MTKTARRVGYIAGFVGAIIITLGALITALNYTGADGEAYSIFNHYVSELGHTEISQLSLLFNLSLIVGAVCLGIHLFCVALGFNGGQRWTLEVFAVIAGVFGMLVGFFPMNVSSIHYYVAVIFFLSAGLYVGFFTAHAWGDPHNRWLAYLGFPMLLSVIVLLISGVIDFTVGGNSMSTAATARPGFLLITFSEWLTIITLIVWVAVMSIHLLRSE